MAQYPQSDRLKITPLTQSGQFKFDLNQIPVASENPVQIDSRSAAESEHHRRMIALGLLFLRLLCDRFKPRQQLEAEILVLRHQLNILQQRAPGRPHFRWVDRALFIWLYRRCPRILNAITVVRPETVLRWHRMGFAAYWRWKSRSPGGRPRIAKRGARPDPKNEP
jgi:hypothetical protein